MNNDPLHAVFAVIGGGLFLVGTCTALSLMLVYHWGWLGVGLFVMFIIIMAARVWHQAFKMVTK